MIENRNLRRVAALPVLLTLLVFGTALASLADGDAPAERPGLADVRHTAAMGDVARLDGRIVHESDALAAPTDVEVVGDELAVLDSYADQLIKTIRRSDGVVTRAFGRKGQGPGEFENVWSVDVLSERELWIHDAMLRRMTHVDLHDDFTGVSEVGDRILRLEANATVLDPVWIDDAILTVGFFQTGRIGYLDGEGRLVRMLGQLPSDAREDVPPAVHQHAFQSKMKPNPSRTRLAVVTRHADILEIYTPSGQRVAQNARPFGFDPVYEVGERAGKPVMATGEDLRFGYVDVTTTDDRIYALFSGRTRAAHPGAANYGEYVHVYDWQGRLLDVHQLDAPAIALAVDEADRTLYSIRHDPFPAIVAYTLP